MSTSHVSFEMVFFMYEDEESKNQISWNFESIMYVEESDHENRDMDFSVYKKNFWYHQRCVSQILC